MVRTHLLIATLGALSAPRPSIAVGGGGQGENPQQTLKMVHKKDAEHPHRFIAGPPTEIDCSRSSSDFEYYVERCHDEITQWWANGRCVDGVKSEVSELHRCQTSHGHRPYCHDCDDGRGNINHVCGSDSPDAGVVCSLAFGSNMQQDCPDDTLGLVSYSHQCTSRQTSFYQQEALYCEDMGAYSDGPKAFACGQEWYYAYDESDDEGLLAADPSLVGQEHPFSAPSNEFCLDCGQAIQVCARDPRATCADLGLPMKGQTGLPAEADNSQYEGSQRKLRKEVPQ